MQLPCRAESGDAPRLSNPHSEVWIVLENPDRFAIRLIEQISCMQLSFHKHSGTGETPMLLFARRQAISRAERSRAHCIIGVPPVFRICAKGDDQKLESQTGHR